LMGKHKPIYDPSTDCGDYVVVTDVKTVMVTGQKFNKKLYIHHTGYPGGLRSKPFSQLIDQNPDSIIRMAVAGMLPKNKLRHVRLKRLRCFNESTHPFKRNLLRRYDQGQTFVNDQPAPRPVTLVGSDRAIGATGRPLDQKPFGRPPKTKGNKRRGRYR